MKEENLTEKTLDRKTLKRFLIHEKPNSKLLEVILNHLSPIPESEIIPEILDKMYPERKYQMVMYFHDEERAILQKNCPKGNYEYRHCIHCSDSIRTGVNEEICGYYVYCKHTLKGENKL